MSRKRTPTGEELQLWQKVTETVAPLQKTVAGATPAKKPAAAGAKEKAAAKSAPAAKAAGAPAKTRPPAPPALNPIDRRTRSRLTRGHVAIDARIDLHGMTQAAAEQRLRRFLADQQADGAKLVLVITGKGRSGRDGEERGVLRRVAPMWLAAADLRPFVVGFDEAGPVHGGAGALYVRIRRAGRAR